jgi:hypothetical protein
VGGVNIIGVLVAVTSGWIMVDGLARLGSENKKSNSNTIATLENRFIDTFFLSRIL